MGLVFIQIIYVTMVYGPIAAFLVELFPPTSATRPCPCPTTWQRLVRRVPAPDRHGPHRLGHGQGGLRQRRHLRGAHLSHRHRPADPRGGRALHQGDPRPQDRYGHPGGRNRPELFDWVAVLAAMGIGFILLLQWNSDFLVDIAARRASSTPCGTTCGIPSSGRWRCGPCRCSSSGWSSTGLLERLAQSFTGDRIHRCRTHRRSGPRGRCETRSRRRVAAGEPRSEVVAADVPRRDTRKGKRGRTCASRRCESLDISTTQTSSFATGVT